jgi:hydrogenase assembly chaperone HypC/HupF
MCLTQPATVLTCRENEVLVAVDGRERLITNLLVPDVRVGDHVLVGLGAVLARISAAEVATIAALRQQAEAKEVRHDAHP